MRFFPRLILLLSVPSLLSAVQTRAQSPEPLAHARRILELLQQGKAPDVAREFNAQMAAASPPKVPAQLWSSMGAEVGALKSEISQQAAGIRTGVTFKSYPDLNHTFMTGTGRSIPAAYQNTGKVVEISIAVIAGWIKSIL